MQFTNKAQEGYVVIIKREGYNMLMTQSPGDHTEVCPSLYISLAKILFESGTSRVSESLMAKLRKVI